MTKKAMKKGEKPRILMNDRFVDPLAQSCIVRFPVVESTSLE